MANYKYIGRKEVAEILGVTPQTISNYVEKGFFDTKRIGCMVYINKETMFDKLPEIKEVVSLENAIEDYKQELEKVYCEYKESVKRGRESVLGNKPLYYMNAMHRLMDTFKTLKINYREDAVDLMHDYFYPVRADRLEDMFVSESRIMQLITRTLIKADERLNDLLQTEQEYHKLQERTRKQHIKLEEMRKEIYVLEKELSDKEDKEKLSNKPLNMEVYELLSTRLSEFNFTVRAINALFSGGVFTIGDLIRCTHKKLMDCRNFGKKTLREVNELLEVLHLDLGMSEDSIERMLHTN